MNIEEIRPLIDKYLSGNATDKEKALVDQWYDRVQGDQTNFDAPRLQVIKTDIKTAVLRGTQNNTIPLRSYLKWAAAIVVISLGTGLLYFNYNTKKPDIPVVAQLSHTNDIPPGRNQAILTLADGSTVNLNNQKRGEVASEGQAVVTKTDEGLLSYTDGQTQDLTPKINMLMTPRGGKYQLVLSDGTKVWLNAATTLRYPVTFAVAQRVVELSGEAYFEVAKNPDKPFRVVSRGQTIEVLGTHFNVNAYDEEPEVKSTLLEGSVKVTAGASSAILIPGQQAISSNLDLGKIAVRNNINLEEAIAWKNDYFQFESADIKTILNQFSRWYDVDVIYQGKISENHYRGKVSRALGVAEALKILNLSGINFKIEGRKIIVR